MQYIRTLWFYMWLVVVCIFGSLLVLATAIFLPLPYRFIVVRQCNLLLVHSMRWLCGMHFKVEGLEHIDKAQAMVIAVNHQSDWETFYLLTLGVPVITVLKKELLRIPFFGWALAVLKPIAIDRTNKSGALKQLVTQGCDHLNNGFSVLIFPEGTRMPPSELGDCNKGAALLASKAGVPILPVVQNSGYCSSPKRFAKKSGLVRVRFGPPIQANTTQELHDKMEAWLSTNLKDLDSQMSE